MGESELAGSLLCGDTLILAMPASGSGETVGRGETVECPRCGTLVEPSDRFCRSCGAEQSAPPLPNPGADDTEALTGTEQEGEGLDAPTEAATRAEPPTERQPHAAETSALAPEPPEPSGAPQPEPAHAREPEPQHEAEQPEPSRARRPQPEPPKQARLRRRLIAVGIAVALGLIAGIVAVIAINGRGHGSVSNSPAVAAGDPVQAVRHHFDLLTRGRYLSAADDLTPALLDSLGGRTVWLSERIADLLISAQLSGSVSHETATTATVRVDSLRTESLVSGCTDFTGSYGLVVSGGRWLIDRADLVSRPC